jgi:hypothetical protein
VAESGHDLSEQLQLLPLPVCDQNAQVSNLVLRHWHESNLARRTRAHGCTR